MGNFSPVLFSIGIIITISGAAKAPEEVGGWPDTWPHFLAGALISLIGLVFWHKQRAAQRRASETTDGADGHINPLKVLAQCVEPIRALGRDIDSLDDVAICQRIDEVLEGFILPIALSRHRITDRLGMEKGAEVLVTLAYGERMLNRVWTAAGDAHLMEARTVMPDALAAIEEAHELVQGSLAMQSDDADSDVPPVSTDAPVPTSPSEESQDDADGTT